MLYKQIPKSNQNLTTQCLIPLKHSLPEKVSQVPKCPETKTQRLIINNPELYDFNNIFTTESGLIFKPKNKEHIIKNHLEWHTNNEKTKFSSFVDILDLADESFKELFNNDLENKKAHVCHFYDAINEKKSSNSYLIYDCGTKEISHGVITSCIIIVLNFKTFEVKTMFPCSIDEFNTIKEKSIEINKNLRKNKKYQFCIV